MKKFAFRLERVERWRALQVHLQEEKARKAIAALDAAKQETMALVNLKRTAAVDLQTGGDPAPLSAYPGFVQKLGREMQSAQVKLLRLDAGVAAERRKLVEVHRGLRLLERLHAKQKQEWQAEVDREEDRFADDAFLGRVQSEKRARSSGG